MTPTLQDGSLPFVNSQLRDAIHTIEAPMGGPREPGGGPGALTPPGRVPLSSPPGASTGGSVGARIGVDFSNPSIYTVGGSSIRSTIGNSDHPPHSVPSSYTLEQMGTVR